MVLLGHELMKTTSNHGKSDDELDLQERSTKKVKEGNHVFDASASSPLNYSDVLVLQPVEGEHKKKYRDKLIGTSLQVVGEEHAEEEDGDIEADNEGEETRMRVEEVTIGGYECPNFVFSKKEEQRLYRPWRRGLIVKLLGRRIGYRALETRLKQMWVRKGVINIIDLSNDYYLVVFWHEEDQHAALTEGPWFIHDHYLTVKEWCPNFQPASDSIKEVAVWVRVTCLPVEYYDKDALRFIGDRIGKTVKVDKATIARERGNYARICVQIWPLQGGLPREEQ
ncbi:uncharacterized protein LOC131632707 [Vicia villosa]|uniref:uncharacterized protein LOC131632707 n=1 Tax=Vicia villosa TaxID=3911 RepID=UPI00273A85CD|nr:uncharacterized protein LOC131632707 [Vicia villosa]